MAIRQYQEQLVAVEGGSAKNRSTIYCNSTDNKPTSDLVNGSRLIEVDTGKEYLFNEVSSSWVEVSGGGGGSSSNYKEVYTGTLNELFSGFINICMNHFETDQIHSMATAFINGDVSGEMTIDASALGLSEYTNPMFARVVSGDARFYAQGVSSILNDWSSYDIGLIYDLDGNFYIKMQQGGNTADITSYASQIPYTLTLYWHEMPSA